MLKRLIDVLLSATALVLVSPIIVLAALAVAVSSGFPVFFRQERVGRNFAPFTLYKIRTMDSNSDGPAVTAISDARITGMGHRLRETKIDELPQLFNVLKGDMSLVGPRPELPAFVDLFREDYEELLRVRPGLTDPAALKYRDEAHVLATHPNPEVAYVTIVLPDKIALSKEYIERRSIVTDLRILLRTTVSLLRRNR